MNPVPRPMVVTAGIALAGVCVLGLYLGIQPSLERSADADEAAAASSAPTAMKPGMAAAVEATPLKTDLPPPSAAPAAQLAQAAKPKAKSDDDDDDTPSSDDQAGAGNGPQATHKPTPPEPPTLYSPDEAPAPPPAGEPSNNTPPY